MLPSVGFIGLNRGFDSSYDNIEGVDTGEGSRTAPTRQNYLSTLDIVWLYSYDWYE
jgi:hypothetical protein